MRAVATVLALLAGADAFVPGARPQAFLSSRSSTSTTPPTVVSASSGDGRQDDIGATASQALATAVLTAALASPLVAPPAATAAELVQFDVAQSYEAGAASTSMDAASTMWMAAGPAPAPYAERKKAVPAPAPVVEEVSSCP